MSSFLGMGQEFMPLIPLFMIISKANGYDRIFGLALFGLPFALGWTSAITNPFTVQIAQKIAEVPIGSGMGMRIIVFFCALLYGLYIPDALREEGQTRQKLFCHARGSFQPSG